jgi:predicted GTPase
LAAAVAVQVAAVAQAAFCITLRIQLPQAIHMQWWSAMAAVEVMQVCLVVMDPTQALTALLRMAAAAVERGKQVDALVHQAVVLVKIQSLLQVHRPKDSPEQQDQVQLLQLAPVAVAERVRLEFVGSSIRNIQALNALQVATAAMDFNIQFPDLQPITAVVVAAVQITTPVQLSILGVAALVAVATVPTTIV